MPKARECVVIFEGYYFRRTVGTSFKLISGVMKTRGIKHTTSECTLRGFTCSGANVDPQTATPAEIAKIRKIQIGYQVDGITGGLALKDHDKSQK